MGLRASLRNDPRLGMFPEEGKSFVDIMNASGTTAIIVQVLLQCVGRSRYTPLPHRNENLVPLKDTPMWVPRNRH